eukprot:s772_g2.t1
MNAGQTMLSHCLRARGMQIWFTQSLGCVASWVSEVRKLRKNAKWLDTFKDKASFAWTQAMNAEEPMQVKQAMSAATRIMQELSTAFAEVEDLFQMSESRLQRAESCNKLAPHIWANAVRATRLMHEKLTMQWRMAAAILKHADASKRVSYKKADETVRLVNEKLLRWKEEAEILQQEAREDEMARQAALRMGAPRPSPVEVERQHADMARQRQAEAGCSMAHHSRPVFRERMSGKRQSSWKPQGRDYGYHQDWQQGHSRGQGKGWDLWRGSWPSSQGQRQQEERYDKTVLPEPKAQAQPSMELLAGAFVPGGSPSLMQEIQKQLTSARRADTKMRKLKEEQEHKTKLWKAYEEDMKKKFSKQKRLFEADLERIDQEAQHAAAQGQQAAQNVKDLVNLGKVGTPEPMDQDDAAWDALVQQDQEEQHDSFLGAALRAAHLRGDGRTGREACGPHGAPGGPATGPDPFAGCHAAMTGHDGGTASAPPGLPAQIPAGVPPAAYVGQHPVDPVHGATRLDPLKDAFLGHFGKVPVSAKIAEKRALRPFGVDPAQTVKGDKSGTTTKDGQPEGSAATILEDDDEELDQAEGPGDPGGPSK